MTYIVAREARNCARMWARVVRVGKSHETLRGALLAAFSEAQQGESPCVRVFDMETLEQGLCDNHNRYLAEFWRGGRNTLNASSVRALAGD